jgi:hypothetical protein
MRLSTAIRLGLLAVWVHLAISASSAIAAEQPLRYLFKGVPKAIYAVTIRGQEPAELNTRPAFFTYTIKSVDSKTGEVRLDCFTIYRMDTDNTPAKQGVGPLEALKALAPLPAPPWDLASQPGFVTWTYNDFGIDPQGNPVRLYSGHPEHLPYSMGVDFKLLLEVMPADYRNAWKVERDSVLKTSTPVQDKTELPTHETVTYNISATQGDLVTIDRKLEMSTEMKFGDEPYERISNTGHIVFDRRRGLIQSLEMRQLLVETDQNGTVRVPALCNARLLNDDEMAKLQAAQDAAEAREKQKEGK